MSPDVLASLTLPQIVFEKSQFQYLAKICSRPTLASVSHQWHVDSNVSFAEEDVDGGTSSDDLVMESEYVVVDADGVQRQEVLHRTEHVKHDGSEMMLTKIIWCCWWRNIDAWLWHIVKQLSRTIIFLKWFVTFACQRERDELSWDGESGWTTWPNQLLPAFCCCSYIRFSDDGNDNALNAGLEPSGRSEVRKQRHEDSPLEG